jgi:hypothetical protein
VLRQISQADLPFFTRIRALTEVAQHLYPAGQPRSPQETAAWLRATGIDELVSRMSAGQA